MKLAFVIQRYGPDVTGGAELLCRQVAERLSGKMKITVITTCAKDYLTWKDAYAPGETEEKGVKVIRFPVDAPRNIRLFNLYSKRVFKLGQSRKAQTRWMKMQGPYSTPLFEHLSRHGASFDLVVFFTYLYATTYFGLKALPGNGAILVPTAHDEPPMRLGIFDEVFNSPAGIIFLTDEERDFIHRRFANVRIPSEVIGMGMDPPPAVDPDAFRSKFGIEDRFIAYVGRVDLSKGIPELIGFYKRYREERGPALKLLLVGPSAMKLPQNPGIVQVGFVSEQDKFNALAACSAFVMPSPFESFSISLLEAWSVGRPAMVNAECEVLKAHCEKSGGGPAYKGYAEFRDSLDAILRDRKSADAMGASGRAYVEANYRWNTRVDKYIEFFKRIEKSCKNGGR
jgi:glycosyltransferase involved in cell wall biosynthesis